MGIFGFIVRYARAAKKESADYEQLQNVMEQIRIAKLQAGKRTITRKLALNALNTANKVSSPTDRVTYV